MSNILAIAQKELRSYFASPIAYRHRPLGAALRLLLRQPARAISSARACR